MRVGKHVLSSGRSVLAAQYRRNVHPALRAAISRRRIPAPPGQETLVSVIVNAADGTEHLELCLNSIVSHSYRNLEILIVDNGVHGRVDARLRGYARWDRRIAVVKPERQVASVARHRRALAGHYVMCVSARDTVVKDALRGLVKILRLTDSDFSAGVVGYTAGERCWIPEQIGRLHMVDCFGVTSAGLTVPPDLSLSGKLFQVGFLADLGWTLDEHLHIAESGIMAAAYAGGRFDLVTTPVIWRGAGAEQSVDLQRRQ